MLVTYSFYDVLIKSTYKHVTNINISVILQTTSANCLVAGENYIFVGCGDAIIRCFNPYNLQFITTLPRTHYLGVDVSKGLTIK